MIFKEKYLKTTRKQNDLMQSITYYKMISDHPPIKSIQINLYIYFFAVLLMIICMTKRNSNYYLIALNDCLIKILQDHKVN